MGYYLYSNFRGERRKTYLFCNRLQGHPRSRWLWYQSKARMRLPISLSWKPWSYLAPFLRFRDLLAKYDCKFSYLRLIWLPRSECSLCFPRRNQSHVAILHRRPHSRVLLETFWHNTTVWRTDGESDRLTIARPPGALHMLCWHAAKIGMHVLLLHVVSQYNFLNHCFWHSVFIQYTVHWCCNLADDNVDFLL